MIKSNPHKTKYVFCLLIIIIFFSNNILFAKDITNQKERNLKITLNYNVNIEGKRSTIVNLTSLLPKTIIGKQEISNMTFSPQPDNTFSQFGNQYAQWKLKGENINNVIEIRFNAKIYQQILKEKTKDIRISKQEILTFLKKEKYIAVNNNSIKQAKNSIKISNNDIKQVNEILNFVIHKMKPSKASRNMLGAVKALKNGKGDCTDYTDIFVTLCRQFKLPAKHISGYILTKNASIGHSWAEVYTKEKGWIIVDPLHMDQKLGNFNKLDNKYLAFSSIRNDPILGKGMLYSWNVKKAKKAKIIPQLIAIDQ